MFKIGSLLAQQFHMTFSKDFEYTTMINLLFMKVSAQPLCGNN